MATHRPTSPVSDSPQPSKGLTDQQRQAVGITALVLCLLVGGGIVYYFMFGAAPKKRTVKVDPQQQTAGMPGGMTRPPPRRQFIVKEDENTWIARGANGAMWVIYEGTNFKLEPFHPNRDFLTAD